jgi:hypothetical protein
MQAYCLRLDQERREQLAAAAASTRLPAAELIRLGIDRLLEQIRRDGGLTLPVRSDRRRAKRDAA